MRREPRLSIGLPVYNGERFLPVLIAALDAQTFRDFEVVISDNASTDTTEQICRDWAARDSRIQYHRNPRNIGACANFNLVFQLGSAPYFKWAACDDTFAPEYLEACVAMLDKHADVAVAQTEVVCIDERQQPFERDAETGQFIIPGTRLRCSVDPIDIGESTSPLRRFSDILFRCRSNSQIFGVMRREALAKTALLPSFLGSEKATVLELSLLGRFAQDRRPLFYRCYHPGITEAKGTEEGKLYMSVAETDYARNMRMLRTFFATPLGKPVSVATKLGCFALLAARSLYFMIRSLLRMDAKDWPFRTAWSSRSRRDGKTA